MTVTNNDSDAFSATQKTRRLPCILSFFGCPTSWHRALTFCDPVLLVYTTLTAKYLPKLDAKASRGGPYPKGCCSDASCNDGTGDVKTVQSLQHWKDLKR